MNNRHAFEEYQTATTRLLRAINALVRAPDWQRDQLIESVREVRRTAVSQRRRPGRMGPRPGRRGYASYIRPTSGQTH